MRSVGLDIGTTTISAVIVDFDKKKVEKSYTIENNSFIQTQNEWEKIQDADLIIKKTVGLLETILNEYDNIKWIGLTGQMHGIVYVDENGKNVCPLYTWQDGRGEDICKEVDKKYSVKVSTGYGLVTHMYNLKNNLVPESAAKICKIMDYLGIVLAERKEPFIHSSNAASLGIFDVEKKCFMKEELEQLCVNIDILPEVTDSYEVIGNHKGIPVITAIGDNQVSFLGSVENMENSILVNMGTGGQVSVLSDKVCAGEDLETRPFNEGKYLIAGSSLCGGRAYALLQNFFKTYTEAAGIEGIDHYAVMASFLEKNAAAENLNNAGKINNKKLHIDTSFSGSRANPDKRGSITNIDVNNFTPQAFIRGVLEGMANELYQMYANVDESVKTNKNIMVASGNGIRKNIHLQKIMEETFGMKIIIAQNQEEAASGAALTGVNFNF